MEWQYLNINFHFTFWLASLWSVYLIDFISSNSHCYKLSVGNSHLKTNSTKHLPFPIIQSHEVLKKHQSINLMINSNDDWFMNNFFIETTTLYSNHDIFWCTLYLQVPLIANVVFYHQTFRIAFFCPNWYLTSWSLVVHRLIPYKYSNNRKLLP